MPNSTYSLPRLQCFKYSEKNEKYLWYLGYPLQNRAHLKSSKGERGKWVKIRDMPDHGRIIYDEKNGLQSFSSYLFWSIYSLQGLDSFFLSPGFSSNLSVPISIFSKMEEKSSCYLQSHPPIHALHPSPSHPPKNVTPFLIFSLLHHSH